MYKLNSGNGAIDRWLTDSTIAAKLERTVQTVGKESTIQR